MPTAEVTLDLMDKMPNESMFKCMPAWARFVCFGAALLFGFMFCSISIKYSDNYTLFYIFWCIGIPLAWLASIFISTFKKQWDRMKKLDNMICSIVIVVCFVLVIVCEAIWHNIWINVWPYIVCFAALIWYNLSLIPGLQQCCKSCFKGIFSCCK